MSDTTESTTYRCPRCGAPIVAHVESDAAAGRQPCDDCDAETYQDAEIRLNRERFAVDLEAFKIAARCLRDRWEAIEDGDAVAGYPEWMPSFDEAVGDFEAMKVRPEALTHDQLQGLARLADDYSKGAHGEAVRSVSLGLRRDGLADVIVNGERQDFAMDEYGNPVNVGPDGGPLRYYVAIGGAFVSKIDGYTDGDEALGEAERLRMADDTDEPITVVVSR